MDEARKLIQKGLQVRRQLKRKASVSAERLLETSRQGSRLLALSSLYRATDGASCSSHTQDGGDTNAVQENISDTEQQDSDIGAEHGDSESEAEGEIGEENVRCDRNSGQSSEPVESDSGDLGDREIVEHVDSESSEFVHSESSEHVNSDLERGNDEEAGGPIEFQSEYEKEQYILAMLREWGATGVSKRKVDELLSKLHPVLPFLPKSYKTLLKTPHDIKIKQLGEGYLWYKGIGNSLKEMLSKTYVDKYQEVVIDVNIDGLPLFKSSQIGFWVILGCLQGSEVPFIICVHSAKKKEEDLDLFLADFVEEVSSLDLNGVIFEGQRLNFRVRHYILDAPARAYVKCIVGHTGYFACEKCTVKGIYCNDRVCFPDLDCPLRSDDSFESHAQPEHHKNSTDVTPLQLLGTGMVSQFRLDYQHLVCHGVFKRLVNTWLKWPGPWKFHGTLVEELSKELVSLARWFPSEFNRKPRPLKENALYKATEWRRLLLYDGIKVFAHPTAVDVNVYKNFLLLHCGISILVSKALIEKPGMLEAAEEYLRGFVCHSASIYGKEFVSYNVHSLVHLPQECRDHGVLDNFSTFKYENKLKSIKDAVKSGYRPLQQLAFRDAELSYRRQCDYSVCDSRPIVSGRQEFAFLDEVGIHYKKLQYKGFHLRVTEGNNCCVTLQGEVLLVQSFLVTPDESVRVIAKRFQSKTDYYSYPVESSLLGIYRVCDVDNDYVVVDVTEIGAKCVLLPDGDGFVSIPLRHV